MRLPACVLVTAFLALTLVSSAQAPSPTKASVDTATRVVIDTGAGLIVVEVDAAAAPRTAGNFLRYVDERFYDGTSFYRVVTPENQPDNLVKIEVIQGGADGTRPTGEPIAIERTSSTGLKHRDGTISMARNGPDTATTEFFICVGDQPELDYGGRRNPDGQGFAAFGRVVAGMEVVRRIHRSPVKGQRLTPPVAITSIRRQPGA
jgi:peptidyl-prolyl cis-trans isomerase A (cyclophilin A)